jgi:hypothetical protein
MGEVWENKWRLKAVTCAYGAATTSEFDIGSWENIAVLMPATITGFPTITFLGATVAGGATFNIFQPNGNEVCQYATQNAWTVCSSASLAPFRFIKIMFGKTGQVSATQSAAKTLYVQGK